MNSVHQGFTEVCNFLKFQKETGKKSSKKYLQQSQQNIH